MKFNRAHANQDSFERFEPLNCGMNASCLNSIIWIDGANNNSRMGRRCFVESNKMLPIEGQKCTPLRM